MAIQFTITINDTQIINGIEYTQEQLSRGLAQIRTQHNTRTGESLSDAEWLQWAHLQNLATWYEQNKGSEPVEPSPVAPLRDWQGLQNALLGGVLYELYTRITAASYADPSTATLQSIANANNISTSKGLISDAITNTTVRIEPALAAGIQLLKQFGYVFTPEEVTLWNSTVDNLNFTSLVHIS
jgi:hypothetical protein